MANPKHSNTEILLDRSFDSFAELSVLGAGWGADFRQLKAEQFPSEIFQCRTASILLAHGRFGCHVDQRGTTPPGMRTFAIPNTNCSGIRWFGRTIDPDSFLLFPKHGEIDAQTRPGFDVITFSVPEQLFVEVSQWIDLSDHGKILPSTEAVIPANRKQIEPLRHLLRQARGLAMTPETTLYDRELVEGIQQQIVWYALQLFSGNSIAACPQIKKKHRSLRLILEFIDGHAHRPIRVSELCDAADVSLRTLQMLFKQEYGITLKAYLTGQRLFSVHRELWAVTQSDVRVLDVARKWGFSHMSQFAMDYHRIFGELPSTTLAKIPGTLYLIPPDSDL